ncbi:glutathione S-transferase C-terminal domain-containing protein [Dyella choica]|uniref:Glutathione S-transferase n=1 Tax=Dyella choica TaxID=1927959 RepID=A0A432M8W5_9GAMM|nr:glutathione S-transferase C-terminal domain-containing protein [Dyella choica]RUL76844.1 glutathione S-transferase [Dyella choica]
MNLYFSPLACSMATRIAFYEAGAEAEFTQVDTKAKSLADGADFYAINPLGQVPVLRTGEGLLLTENTAILPFVAEQFPASGLAPVGAAERASMQQWLGFISTELHTAVFIPLLDSKAPDGAKAYAREKAGLRLDVLQRHLASRLFLLGHFTVADAYLFVVLNWAAFSGIQLQQWPGVAEYYQRLAARPSIARALSEEIVMYNEQRSKRAKA